MSFHEEASHEFFSSRHLQSRALPQYGFGADFTFESLVQDNPFLFRVHTPKSSPHTRTGARPAAPQRASTSTDLSLSFLAQRFESFEDQEADVASRRSSFASARSASDYADVVRHLDWTTRHESPFISTSFSFAWAVWEAAKRYRVGMKHDVHIAVIDGRALADRAVTALELLRKSDPKDRHKDYWKWYNFAQESQDVLVHGSIPSSAIYTSIPLMDILNLLPSCYLSDDDNDDNDSQPSEDLSSSYFLIKPHTATIFDKLAWTYSSRKPSFRHFCQLITESFLRHSHEQKLLAATEGAVALALAFFRPWFESTIMDDPGLAVTELTELSYTVSQWPAQWWVRDHANEVRTLIRALVLQAAEDARASKQTDRLDGSPGRQGGSGGAFDSRRLREIIDELDKFTQRRPSRSLHSRRGSRASVTPPESVTEVGEEDEEEGKKEKENTSVHEQKKRQPLREPVFTPPSPSASSSFIGEDADLTLVHIELPTEKTAALEPEPEELTAMPMNPPQLPLPEPPTVVPSRAETPIPVVPSKKHSKEHHHDDDDDKPPRDGNVQSVVTCVLTGLIFGAFVTLCLVNSQRRALIHLT